MGKERDSVVTVEICKIPSEMLPISLVQPVHKESSDCWCSPRLDYRDPVTGVEVWEHFEKDEAN